MSPRRRRPPRAGALRLLSPLRILRQIALLQAAYYVVATVLISFTTLVIGRRFALDLILDWQSIRGDTTVGWTLGLCWMMASFLEAMFLLVLVNRSKMVPDFALSLHFIHFLVTSAYTRSLPTNRLWWGLQACSSALMTFLGIKACQWRELQPIRFGDAAGKAKAAPAEEGGADENDDADPGGRDWQRMLGSGGRDAKGSYEMANMEDANAGVRC